MPAPLRVALPSTPPTYAEAMADHPGYDPPGYTEEQPPYYWLSTNDDIKAAVRRLLENLKPVEVAKSVRFGDLVFVRVIQSVVDGDTAFAPKELHRLLCMRQEEEPGTTKLSVALNLAWTSRLDPGLVTISGRTNGDETSWIMLVVGANMVDGIASTDALRAVATAAHAFFMFLPEGRLFEGALDADFVGRLPDLLETYSRSPAMIRP